MKFLGLGNKCWKRYAQQGYQYSPAQRLMSRKLRDVIPAATSQLFPQAASRQVVVGNIEERRARSKAHYDKRASGPALKPFTPGEKVFVGHDLQRSLDLGCTER